MTEAATAPATGNGEIQVSPAPGAVAAPAAPAPQTSWYEGFDQDTVAWLDNRGVTKLGEKEALKNLTEGFRNAQKFIGAPPDKLLRMPDFEKADKAELDQFYTKLGRPADPSGYEIELPEGSPTDFAESFKKTAHELGLTQAQAKALVNWNNEQGQQMTQAQLQAYQESVQRDEMTLKAEWGVAYDQQIAAAQRAAHGLGLNAEQIDAMEKSMGFSNLMKMMSKIGSKLGEDKFVGSESQTSSILTPSAAKEKIAQLTNDKEWVKKYLNGNVEARAEMDRLQRLSLGIV